MTNPTILWRESFGYGSLVWSQVYLGVGRSTNTPYGVVSVGTPGNLAQWGRGSGGDAGYAMQGGTIGMRATQLGFSGAIDTNAVSNNKVGLAFAYNQAGNVGGSVLAEFWDDDGLGDGSFDRALLHLMVETLNDGRICVKNGTNSGSGGPGTVIATSSFVLPVGLNGANGNFTHIEITQPVIHATNGSVQVYADGNLILNVTGAATRNALGGSGKIGYVQGVARNVSGAVRIITDVIVHKCDNSGRILDKRVSYRRALVAGTHTAGATGGSGSPATLLAAVNEQQADGDVSYIQFTSSALPKAASFTCEPMPANCVSIDEVTPHVIVRKTDASADTGRQELKSGAGVTFFDNGSDVAVPSGYNVLTLTGPAPGYQLDPFTSAAWSIPNCDNAEVGYRRTA